MLAIYGIRKYIKVYKVYRAIFNKSTLSPSLLSPLPSASLPAPKVAWFLDVPYILMVSYIEKRNRSEDLGFGCIMLETSV